MRRSTSRKCRLVHFHLAVSLAVCCISTGAVLADTPMVSPSEFPGHGSNTNAQRKTVYGQNESARPLQILALAEEGSPPSDVATPIAPENAPPSNVAYGILQALAGSPPSIAGEPTPLLAALKLNQVARGDFALLFFADGDYWLAAADAAALGLTVPAEAYRQHRGEKYVSLKAMGATGLEFNERDLTLSLELPPATLARQHLDTGKQPNFRQLTGNDEFSSILNYQASLTGTDHSGTKPIGQIATELATRWKGVLFRHSSAYFSGNTPLKYARYETQALYDDPESLRRWTFGDTLSYSGPFGSALPVGGISVAKFYGFDPRFIRFPLAGFSTFASTPSELTVSYQGIPMLQRQIQPGPVDISNLYYYGGARSLDVTIRDALGRVRSFNVPFYFTDEVLGKGINEYSYQLGRLRNNAGDKFNHYERTAAFAFYRTGLTDFLTLGVRGEASGDIANAGMLAALRSNFWGVFSGNLSYGGSRDQARYATASEAAYAYQAKEAGLRISLARSGDAYRILGNGSTTLLGADSRIIRELRASASYNASGLGLFAVDIGRRRTAAGEDIRQRGLSFSKSLARGLIVILNINDTTGTNAKREIFLNLNWNLDATHNAAATVRSSNTDGESYSTSFNKSIPSGPGTGYRIDTDSLRTGDGSGNRVHAFSQWNADVLQLRGEASLNRFGDSGTTRTYSADISGAISFAGGRWAMSRPIIDSFALVALSEPIAGVRVFQNNQFAGVTNGDGQLILPTLSAFQENQIMLEHRDIPLDFSFGTLNKSLYPPFRSGQHWLVDVYRSQTFGAHLRARIGDQLQAVQPGSGKLFVNGQAQTFLIGNDGAIFLERMKPGEYSGEITIDSRNCNFKLTIPVTKESYVKLGQITVCD